MDRVCWIMSGPSGVGKSHKALEIQSENQNTEIVSADYFWDKDGYYEIGRAHV